MADKENSFSLEQRSYCKIRALLVYSPSDIKADLDKVYGVNVLSYHMVARWVRNFKDGRESVENEPRPGKPLGSLGESEISAVKNAAETDARYTVEKIAEITNISSSTVFRMLNQQLKLRKVCARWVSDLLTAYAKLEVQTLHICLKTLTCLMLYN